MIYTVGHAESYRRHMADMAAKGERARKIGPRKSLEFIQDGQLVEAPYGGGIAFRTPEEAAAYNAAGNSKERSVFSLEGEWVETRFDPELGFHRINRDMFILGEAVPDGESSFSGQK